MITELRSRDQIQGEGSQCSCDNCRHLLLAESRNLEYRPGSWWWWHRPAERGRKNIKCRKALLISLEKNGQREGSWKIVRRHKTVKEERLRKRYYQTLYEWAAKAWTRNPESWAWQTLNQAQVGISKAEQAVDNWGGVIKNSARVSGWYSSTTERLLTIAKFFCDYLWTLDLPIYTNNIYLTVHFWLFEGYIEAL